MTEYEINKEVAHKLGKPFYGTEMFDPCNDAEQACDIMLANNISVTKDGDVYCALHNLYHMGWGDWRIEREMRNEKPFVAAMLLFLEV